MPSTRKRSRGLLEFCKISKMFYSRIQAEIFQDRSQSGNMPFTYINTRKWSNYSKTNPTDLWNFRWKSGRCCPFLQLLCPSSWGQRGANKVVSPVTSVKETWSYCCGHIKSLLMSVCLVVITQFHSISSLSKCVDSSSSLIFLCPQLVKVGVELLVYWGLKLCFTPLDMPPVKETQIKRMPPFSLAFSVMLHVNFCCTEHAVSLGMKCAYMVTSTVSC